MSSHYRESALEGRSRARRRAPPACPFARLEECPFSLEAARASGRRRPPLLPARNGPFWQLLHGAVELDRLSGYLANSLGLGWRSCANMARAHTAQWRLRGEVGHRPVTWLCQISSDRSRQAEAEPALPLTRRNGLPSRTGRRPGLLQAVGRELEARPHRATSSSDPHRQAMLARCLDCCLTAASRSLVSASEGWRTLGTTINDQRPSPAGSDGLLAPFCLVGAEGLEPPTFAL